uniref:J domain-containing protein n=1 Tax=Lotharella oceanica TaxID=641309 RepID=A0A7S2TVW4_9EUKA|mmetsp:Transcript_32145/g.59852  ORF Transcript_32145/g.59852 Transcript_32145/m.59852 type:complete len:728 (+) Transcript_32145:42-2225(+)
MAFEVFDDAAFSYFLLTILAMILTPWTLSKLCDAFGICNDDDEEEVRKLDNITGYQVQKKPVEEEKPSFWRCSNIVYMSLVAAMFLIVFSLPSADTELQKFHPFEILELDVGASDRDIKKAYRKLSLKFHPDKNPGDEVAAKEFIRVSKAYQTLTDPETKKNWEVYGNPDGYQGTSVTIGLPSFLTDKTNEFPVLVAYFILIIIIPPILVFMWWKNAKEMGPEGIMHKTIQYYYSFIDQNWSENMVHKFAALYASSAEFQQELDKICPPRYTDEWIKLKRTLESTYGKKTEFGGKYANVMNTARIQAGSILLQAYIRRIPIPPMFEKQLSLMLKYTDKLIPGMLGVTYRYNMYGKPPYANPCFAVVKFNQMLVQAMWAHDPIFKQLPHECYPDIKKVARKIKTWDRFLAINETQKKKIFKDYTEEQKEEILRAAAEVPLVDMTWKYGVEDEKDVFTGDLVTVDVTLFRKGAYDPKPEDLKEEDEKEVDEEEDEDASDKEEEAISTLDFVEQENKERNKKKKKRQVLAPYFPHVKHEVWYVILVSPKGAQKLVSDLQRVDLDDFIETNLRFKVPDKKGKYKYEVHALCDSYVGCDISCEFEIVVKEDKKRKTEEDYQREKEERDREEEEEVRRLEEEHPPRWYYCWYSSFGELVVNAIVFALLCVFIFNFLHSRGYWQDYIQPVIDISYNATCKYVYDLEPIFNPPEKIDEEFDFGATSSEYMEDAES